MDPHIESHNDKIDLGQVSFVFCENQVLSDYCKTKSEELKDRDTWIRKNHDQYTEKAELLTQAVKLGIIPNTNIETIYHFLLNKAEVGQKQIQELKEDLEKRTEEIKRLVSARLSKFLPQWTSEEISIVFTINEKSDFCIDGNKITVDLYRLTFEDDYFEKVIQGVTHELFHAWMFEKSEWSDSKQDQSSDQEIKDRILFKTIDEGLAVLISEQSMQNHHEKKGRNYSTFTQDAFAKFNSFLKTTQRADLEKIKNEEFEDSGPFYVVGSEIARIVLEKIGITKFKSMLNKLRINPVSIIEAYQALCKEDTNLIQIDIVA